MSIIHQIQKYAIALFTFGTESDKKQFLVY